MGPLTVDFNRLPPQTRQRFIDATRRQGSPAPLLSTQTGVGGAIFGWAVLGVCGLGLLALMGAMRFGSSYMPTQAAGAVVAYVAGWFLVVVAVLYAIKRSLAARALPWDAGTYVFPMDLVEARSRQLRIFPMSTLQQMQPTHHHRNGVYSGTSFGFTFQGGGFHNLWVGNKVLAEQTLTQLRESRQRIGEAAQKGDMATVAAGDLFFEARMNDAWQAAEPAHGVQARDVPAWMGFAWALALGAAVVLALPTWGLRNLISDNVAFGNVKNSQSISALESYAEHGWLHRDEVKNDLLPRAVLKDAQARGTVRAIRAFLKAYPKSVVQADAEKALDEAYRTELAAVKKRGSVTKLREFLQTYPKSPVEADAKKALHVLFDKTRTDFRKASAGTDASAEPYVDRLVTYLENNGSPPFLVKFDRRSSPSLAAADRLLATDEPGHLALASSHFDDSESSGRESAMVRALASGFGEVFPSDIVRLERATSDAPTPSSGTSTTTAATDEDAALDRYDSKRGADAVEAALDKYPPLKPSKAASPVMNVQYEVGWSGSQYRNAATGHRAVGIKINFNVSMTLPNLKEAARCPPTAAAPLKPEEYCPVRFKLDVAPPQQFTVSSYENPEFASTLSGSGDGQVYEVMAARAFDQVATKLASVFFKPHARRAAATR